jgi:tetratricopeptide (TPR) repeat protein
MKRIHFAVATLLCVSFVVPVRPATAGNWTSVRTRNLFLISDASASELRQVASWLELFHSAVSGLTSRQAFNSSIPTVGIVFRSKEEFDQFKPLYQGKPADLAGYFQPGDDVNYIAIPLEPGEPLYAVFHEYVHLFVKDNMPNAPLWLNEGLAEFYSTASIGNGEATIGTPIGSYVRLLRASELLPLKTLFSVNGDSAHYHDRDKRGIFYAESWALVHYLMLANNGERQSQVGRYLSLTGAGVSVEAAFNMAFQTNFASIEKELGEYLNRGAFPTRRVGSIRSDGYGSIQTEALNEAEADYYLGDLLLHIGQPINAEKYFVTALSLDQNLILAHAALGMLRVRQGRFAEVLRHLQRAAPTSPNHLVHFFYAYALSRQGMSEDGTISHYTAENLETMRSQLQTTIKLAPDFGEAYHLLAFINLVANERLDQSVDLIKRAMSLEPNRPELKLVLAQIYLKQRDNESAHRLLEPLARQNDDPQLRAQAELLLANNSKGASRVPQISTAAPTKMVSVSQPGATPVSSGMRIDTSGPLPTADEVIAKYIEALGGQDRIRQVTSRVTRGRARVPGEFTDAPFELSEKSPNKSVMFVKPERLNRLGQGFDGTIGWVQAAPGGLHRVQGVELSELQRDCDFYAPLRLKANYPEVKLLGRVKIGYREAYLVEAKPSGGDAEKFYFETESGMLIRWDGVRSNWRERALIETYYDDWREVQGIKVPFRVTRSSPHFTIAFTVDEVKHDVAIDDMVFTQRVGR